MADDRLDEMARGRRFLVIQNGARHDYAIPMAFLRAKALAGLYTDLVATQGIGSLLRRYVPERSELGKTLSRRTPPAELQPFVESWSETFLLGEALQRGGFHAVSKMVRAQAERATLKRGMQGATHIYSMFGEGGTIVEAAKERGLKVVCDAYIPPSADQIVAEEAALHPDWADGASQFTTIEERVAINRVLVTQSDLIVCPSQFVRDDLVAHGVSVSRTTIAPYAVSPKWLTLKVKPEPGRILFAGSAILRKGIHTLAAAASILKGRCQVRVAGAVSDKVRQHPDAVAIEFLGHLGPIQMADEFARADVFAFPSLVEGSAGVTAEALGAGVPVVTTVAAGSIVRDAIDGYIVPARDPERLAESILAIVKDREKRQAMSMAARRRAQEFSWDGFASSVFAALDSIPVALHSDVR